MAEEQLQRPPKELSLELTDILCEPVQHRLVEKLLHSFDARRRGYEPVAELRELYPTGVAGCWLVDSVMPDTAPSF